MLPLQEPSLDSPGYKLGIFFISLPWYYINKWTIFCLINNLFFFRITAPGVPLQLTWEVNTCKWICWQFITCQGLYRKAELLKTAGSKVISWNIAWMVVTGFFSVIETGAFRSVLQHFIFCKSYSSGWFKVHMKWSFFHNVKVLPNKNLVMFLALKTIQFLSRNGQETGTSLLFNFIVWRSVVELKWNFRIHFYLPNL